MNLNLKSRSWGRIRAEIVDAATGAVLSAREWQQNLVMDQALNAFANSQQGYAACFSTCLIGSGTTPNSYSSGAVTFTQTGTTITASGSFFTSAMIGGIFKYGTGSGGAEYYISGVASPTSATVDTSATHATPSVATVWQVQQTGMAALLYSSATYDASAGACVTTVSGNQIYLQRTFIFPVQSSPYTVNEIGYCKSGTAINGRIVLSSSDTVAPTAFYRVQIGLTFTQSPGSPIAAADVGTNVNSAGTLSINYWGCQIVRSNGGIATYQSPTFGDSSPILDGVLGVQMAFHTGTPPTNFSAISPANASPASESYTFALGAYSNTTQPIGVGISSGAFTFTAAGESMNSIIFGYSNGVNSVIPIAVLLLTTPVTLPTGVFTGSASVKIQFSRTLNN
jgi:hypothetical protein